MKMKYWLLSILLLPTIALAQSTEELCGACRCRLEERPPEWIRFHDLYWSCFNGFRQQQVEYGRCLGAIRELEARLSKRARRKYVAFVENPNVLNYPFKQHPVEDAGGNTEVAEAQAVACQVQLGSQIIPEVLNCSAHLQALRKLK